MTNIQSDVESLIAAALNVSLNNYFSKYNY
jgi:hypothetical protein